jgi:ABC-type bacteriocin/lantibiotic exporter with double-glycine peptidase domain
MAMILAEWVDRNITPVETSKMAIEMQDRSANSGTEWVYFSKVAEKYDMPFVQAGNVQRAVKALQDGALVICSMSKGYFTNGGHYVLAYKTDNKDIFVNDPANKAKTKASISTFDKECRQYFIFKKSFFFCVCCGISINVIQ